MSDSLITIVAIFLAAILMFIFPLMSVAERSDDISQLSVQSATVKFVDDSATLGKITWPNYNAFVQSVNANGGKWDIQMEAMIKDENVGKKSAMLSGSVIGENTSYSEYNEQILNVMRAGGDNGIFAMKEGDVLSVTVKNDSKSLAQSLRSMFYSVTGSGSSNIVAQHSRMVTANSTATK